VTRRGDKAFTLILSHGEHASLRRLARRSETTMVGVVRDLIAAESEGLRLRLDDEERRWIDAIAKQQGVSTSAALRNLLFESWQARKDRAP